MMSVKSGTQTFSSAAQTSSLKSDGAQSALPEDFQKVFGDKSVGEVANQIADPNWVDPQKVRNVGNNQLDKDAFLKLMLTQMKNQDPTNPLQSHEMAAQLAQFTSLEQLFNINETLGSMKKSQDPAQNFQALSFIGKAISGDTSKVIRGSGDKEHELRFELPSAAKEIKVEIKSQTGEVVRTYNLSNLDAGKQSLVWNGMKEDGLTARPGEYNFVIEAKGANNAKLAPKTSFEGRITGVNYTKEGPVLMIGNQSVRMADVKKIVDPDQMEAQKANAPKSLDLSKSDQEVENKGKAAQHLNGAPTRDDLLAGSNLDALNMAGSFQEQITRETQSE